MRSAEGGSEILPGAAARINKAACAKGLPCVPINVSAMALFVGGERSAEIGALIPVDSEPTQVFESGAGVFRPAAIWVEILHSHDQQSTSFTSSRPCAMKSPGVAQVKEARRRWCETTPIGRVGHGQEQSRDSRGRERLSSQIASLAMRASNQGRRLFPRFPPGREPG